MCSEEKANQGRENNTGKHSVSIVVALTLACIPRMKNQYCVSAHHCIVLSKQHCTNSGTRPFDPCEKKHEEKS